MQTPAIHSIEKTLIERGIDMGDANFRETPDRVNKWLSHFTQFCVDKDSSFKKVEALLSRCFPTHDISNGFYCGVLKQNPIKVYSVCSHHLLPAIYTISFAYKPKDNRMVGFSKISRFLSFYAQQPINQEDYTKEAAELFDLHVRPQAVALNVKGVHFCTKIRGAMSDAINETRYQVGEFEEDQRSVDDYFNKSEFVW